MHQGVHAGIGGYHRGHGYCQCRVDNCHVGEGKVAVYRLLEAIGFIGDDKRPRHFAASPCGGRYKYLGETATGNRISTRIIEYFSSVGGYYRSAFGYVQGTPSADADDDIISPALGHLNALVGNYCLWLGLYFVKNVVFYFFSFK